MSETETLGPGSSQGVWRPALEHWKKAAHSIGVVQTRAIMVVIYLIAVLPVGLVFRVVRDPLQMQRPAGGNWVGCRDDEASLDRSRQQF